MPCPLLKRKSPLSSELILIVDDNKDVRAFVRAALEAEKYEVVEAIDGNDALLKFHLNSPAVVVLDLNMGHPDGFEVCREIRRRSVVPIIMLTDRGSEVDEAMCLAAGADDYISKPVSPRILALRVSTQIRHSRSKVKQQIGIISTHGLALNLETRQLDFEGGRISVTRTEFDFLRLLMEHPHKVFTREEVIKAIGSSAEFSTDHFLDTHASRLRLKIKRVGGPKVIMGVRGVGYRLTAAHGSNEEPHSH